MDVYWLEQYASDVPDDNDWLSANERARADLIRIPKRHADYRLGRWTAKCAVIAYLDMVPDLALLSKLDIRPDSTGAPRVFLDDALCGVSISLTHSAGTAACAVAASGVSLGCDIEGVEPRSAAFVEDYFTTNERALVAACPRAQTAFLTNLIWSAKESALKAIHEGLRLDTRSVEVNLLHDGFKREGNWHPLRAYLATGIELSGWYQFSGNSLVRTVVSLPQTPPPVLLQHPCFFERAARRN